MRRTLDALRTLLAVATIASGAFAEAPPPQERPAGGIRTDFGDVQIDNLGIGRTYNLRELAGTPLKVTNTGGDTVNIVMTVEIPTDAMITDIRKELGYKAIPSPDWVSLSASQFVVPSGESAYTDVIIKIPDDPALYGKKFQASIYSRTTGAGMVNLGVWSHLQLNIVKSPEDQAAIEKNKKRGTIGNMDYTLLPDKLVIENVKPGSSTNIRKDLKRTIMIANSGADPIRLRVKSVRVGDTPLSLQTGFEEGKIEWLGVAEKEVTVDGASFTDPGLTLTLPKDDSLKGKKLMLVLKVEPADPDVIGLTYYGKIYVEVAK